MEVLLQACSAWVELEEEHRHWLSTFDRQYLRNWEKVRNGNYEAALCEAAGRRMLQSHDVTVEPNEDLSGFERRADFRCSRNKRSFLVELTCIPIAKAVEETGLPHPFQPGFRAYRHLNDAIFMKCWDKNSSQCSGTDLPTLLAVGTFHFDASVLCMSRKFANMLLTGETSLSWNVNMRTGEGVGDIFQTTELHSASFLKPGMRSIRKARASLSGLLLCGFGCIPPKVIGVLHPLADRPFDRQLLPDIPFGEVRINQDTGRLCTAWHGGNEDGASKGIENFLP